MRLQNRRLRVQISPALQGKSPTGDWDVKDQLAAAIFEWIETWYNPHRRHSYNQGLSPLDYETAHAA